jgi:hypothetical protein
MKTLSIFFLLFFVSTLSFAQDVIIKRDGTKIEVKVLEVNPTTIKYRNFSQPEGPLRTIQVNSVSEIIYEDGQFEKFELKATEPAKEEVKITVEKDNSVKEEEEDPIFKNGFFLDAMVGYGFYDRTSYQYYYDPITGYGNDILVKEQVDNIAISLRIGNKWYFGSREKWRPGFQVKWIRLGIYIEPNNPESIIIGTKTFSIANVGMVNAFKLSEKSAVEANFTVGPNIELDLDYGEIFMGLAFNPEFKFRYNNLAVGLDYTFIYERFGANTDARNWNILAMSVGFQF